MEHAQEESVVVGQWTK